MTSPTKRRKKNTSAAPQQSRNLEFFFEKQRQAAASASQTSPPKSDPKATIEGLTDEEYARNLAEKWAKEDNAVALRPGSTAEESKHGAERRRNYSPINAGESFVLDKIEERETPETTTPPTLTKTAVSLEAALETDALIKEMPFDNDPFSFDPNTYKGIANKWPAGKAPYALLTRAFVLVNLTRSRIKIVNTLVNLVRTLIRLDPDSLLAAVCFYPALRLSLGVFAFMEYHSMTLMELKVWLTTNDIGPPYENNELGLGGSVISKALTNSSGITAAALKKLFNKHGDPGDVAFEAKMKQRTLTMMDSTPLSRWLFVCISKFPQRISDMSPQATQRLRTFMQPWLR